MTAPATPNPSSAPRTLAQAGDVADLRSALHDLQRVLGSAQAVVGRLVTWCDRAEGSPFGVSGGRHRPE